MQTDCKSGTQKKDFKYFMKMGKSDFGELLKSYKANDKYRELN